MGRRKKTELLGLTERIIRMYTQDKMTIEQITDALNDEGIDISREAIRHSVKSSKEVAETFARTIEESKILIDTVRANPNSDVIETCTTLLAQKIFEYVRNIEDVQFENPLELSIAINKMAAAQTQIAKLRLDFEKGFNTAKKEFIEDLKKELKAYPDLMDRLISVVTSREAII